MAWDGEQRPGDTQGVGEGQRAVRMRDAGGYEFGVAGWRGDCWVTLGETCAER
jgi:hypothetical protein